MALNYKKYWLWIVILLGSCVERYDLPQSLDTQRYLVVDSFLDPVKGTCTVSLRWTQKLSEKNAPLTETGATITLEDDQSNFSLVKEVSSGNYAISNLNINTSRVYRINIATQAGVKYQSVFVKPLITPPIDSLSWDEYFDQIRIKISSHDPSDNTRFYRWTFDETWEYKSAFHSYFEIKNGSIVPRTEDVYTCWKTEASSDIHSATSSQLSHDVISDFTLTKIKKDDERLFIRYSINVKQMALDANGYDYLNILKKTTQNLGTPYDPLPSQVTGNFTCINGNAAVLGYFFSSSVQEQRIFIDNKKLPADFQDKRDYGTCAQALVLNALIDYKATYAIVFPYFEGDNQVGYFVTSQACVDCRLEGGKNVKPSFW